MTINLSLSINLTDLFGANASQTEQTLTIDLMGETASMRAESILVALLLRLWQLGKRYLLARTDTAITANGQPLTFPDVSLTANGQSLTANGQPLLIQLAGILSAIDLVPLTANGQPITYRDPELHDLYCEIDRPRNIYQRGQLDRVQSINIQNFVPYE
jgi:hypothetical protein